MKVLDLFDPDYLAIREVHNAERALRHVFGFLFLFFSFRYFGLRRLDAKDDEAIVSSKHRTQESRLSGQKLAYVCARIVRWRNRRMIAAWRALVDAGGEITHDYLTVAVLRHVRIGDEFSVARNLRRLNRMP